MGSQHSIRWVCDGCKAETSAQTMVYPDGWRVGRRRLPPGERDAMTGEREQVLDLCPACVTNPPKYVELWSYEASRWMSAP